VNDGVEDAEGVRDAVKEGVEEADGVNEGVRETVNDGVLDDVNDTVREGVREGVFEAGIYGLESIQISPVSGGGSVGATVPTVNVCVPTPIM
jgi:hypothetical protein